MNYQFPYQFQMNQNMYTRPQEERIWVPNQQAAEVYLMAPNSFVRLWDSNANVFYEKRTDASGRPSMEAFEYARRAPQEPPRIAVPAADGKMYEERIQALEKRIIALEEGNNGHDADVSAVSAVPQ